MRSNESNMQELLAEFFSSEQWQENWSWSEDEPGLIVYDLVDTDAIQKLIATEAEISLITNQFIRFQRTSSRELETMLRILFSTI